MTVKININISISKTDQGGKGAILESLATMQRCQDIFQRMRRDSKAISGKAGELIPTYRKKIVPVAPSTGPSRPTPPTWVARSPTPGGLEAMKKCQDTVSRMTAASFVKKNTNWTKTLTGPDRLASCFKRA